MKTNSYFRRKGFLPFFITMIIHFSLNAQVQPKSGVFPFTFNRAFTIDSLLWGNTQAYSCYLFPDTNILIESQGNLSRPEIHGIAELMDWNSAWFPHNRIDQYIDYFLDSLSIYGVYKRAHSDTSIVDTLIVQFGEASSIDSSLTSYNYPWLMYNYGEQIIPYYSIFHDNHSSLSTNPNLFTLKLPLSAKDTGFVSVPPYSVGKFTVGVHCGVYFAAGKRPQVIVSFKPGYSYSSQDTLNKLNYFKFISQEQNGANTFPNYSDDYCMSYVLNSEGLYSYVDTQYTPSFRFSNASYRYEDHWIDFHLSTGHMDPVPDTMFINCLDTLTYTGITDNYFDYKIHHPSDTSWLKIVNINGDYYYKTNPNYGGDRSAYVTFSNCTYSLHKVLWQRSTGIEETKLETVSVKVQPNPMSDQTTFELNLYQAAKMTLYIYDLHGRRVYNQQMKLTPGANKFPINTNKFQSGVFIYQIIIDGKEFFGKLIKQ